LLIPRSASRGVAVIAGSVVASIFAPDDVRGALVGLLTALAGFLRVSK
jgi:hypothetical protein